MSDFDLDLTSTEDLIGALNRRSDAAIVVVQRSVNGRDADDRVFSYSGGLANALGMCAMLRHQLLMEFEAGEYGVDD